MELSDIIQIVIGMLSLIATVAVSFFIYWLQMRHEKEIERIEAKRAQKELEEKAHLFLSENSDEIDYLPWCSIAAQLFRHDKHTRLIYTNFCRCSEELQNEILHQAGYVIKLPERRDWPDLCLDYLREDIKKHKLGRDYLYDGAKYFHRGYERYRHEKWDGIHYKEAFDTIAIGSGFFKSNKTCLLDYIDEYFLFLYSENRPALYNHNPKPPLDYMWDVFDLYNAKEIDVCRWMIEAVYDICIICHNREGSDGLLSISTDAVAETFEDKYYETLLWLFNAYGIKLEENNPKKKSKKKNRVVKQKKRKQKESKPKKSNQKKESRSKNNNQNESKK